MDLFDVTRACLRRWYVVVPVLLLSGVLAYSRYAAVKPLYYSQAIVGLAPPNSQVQWQQPGEPVPRNGLLDSGGPVLLANLTVLGLRQQSVVDQVAVAGGSPTYYVRMLPSLENQPPLPLIQVENTQADPGSVQKTVDLVAGQADAVLQGIQQRAGVSESQRVRALVASPAGPPIGSAPSRTKAAVGTMLAGAGLAVLAGVIVDVFANRRRRRTAPAGVPDNPLRGNEPYDDEDQVRPTVAVKTSV